MTSLRLTASLRARAFGPGLPWMTSLRLTASLRARAFGPGLPWMTSFAASVGEADARSEP